MPETTSTEYIVSECATHGTKATGDRASFITYVRMSTHERNMGLLGYEPDLDPGVSPWVCCEDMVIDPEGVI